MTDQERQLIRNLIQRIQTAPPPHIDREADELIRREIGTKPDAFYILVQSVLLQEMALDQARAQIDQLKQQAPPSSFLGTSGNQSSGYQSSRYQQDPPPPPPVQYVQEQPRSGFSSFLHNAAQTAAGIVAGEVAFSAISSLFGNHGGYGGGGYGMGSGFLGGGGGETIVNNYYEGGNERPLEHGLSPDLEDRRFAGSDDTTPADSTSDDDSFSNDDASGSDSFTDDSSSDDGSDV